jgi:hypothetical protein
LDDFSDVLVIDVPVLLLLVSFCIETGSGIIHILVVAGSGIFVVGGDVDNGTSLDWKVGIANSVSRSDFWALCVQGNGKRSAWKFLLCGFGVVYDRLVVLKMGEYFAGLRNALSRKLTSYDPWEKFMRTTLRPTMKRSVEVISASIEGIFLPLRRSLILSTELVFGPVGSCQLVRNRELRICFSPPPIQILRFPYL